MTRDEKIDAISDGGDIATMMKFGVEGLHYDPDAKTDEPNWHGLTMAEKVTAVQQATDDGESIVNLIN